MRGLSHAGQSTRRRGDWVQGCLGMGLQQLTDRVQEHRFEHVGGLGRIRVILILHPFGPFG
jgi:hypothetical protein